MRIVFLLAFAACSRTNDIAALRFQAGAIAAINQPRLYALVERVHGLQRELRGDLPGWPNMFRTAQLANDELGLPPFEQTTPPGVGWRPSPTTLLGLGPYVQLRAGELDHRDELQRLVADERARYEHGIASVTEHLVEVESWLRASAPSPSPSRPLATATPR